jgi:hypothetical protein
VKPIRESLLGEATSTADGHFTILIAEASRVQPRRSPPVERKETFALKVFSESGHLYLTSGNLSTASRFPVTLEVPLAEKPVTTAMWQEMGNRMEEARLVRVNELVRQLVLTVPEESLFADWDLETRHSIVNELERAFLDPEGVLPKQGVNFGTLRHPESSARFLERVQPHLKDKRGQKALAALSRKASSFGGLYEVDWLLDPGEFKQGKPGAGLSKFEDAAIEGVHISEGTQAVIDKATDLSRYRDYLRAVYTGPAGGTDYAARKQNLERRFHQNFWTNEAGKVPANKILVPIVKAILSSPTDNSYGFGINTAQIAPQGERSDREYLEYLVSLSHLSLTEFGLRYRLAIGRPDSAISSRVEENIHTLQRFLSDTYQCAREPFPIISEELEGKAPFYLQYEEWRRQTKPFYAETVYQIKRTFDIGIKNEDIEYFIESVANLSESKFNYEQKRFYTGLALMAGQVAEGHRAYNLGEQRQALEYYKQAYNGASSLVSDFQQNKSKIAGDFDLKTEFLALKNMQIKDTSDLQRFIDSFTPYEAYSPKIWQTGPGWVTSYDAAYQWVTGYRDTVLLAFFHAALYVLPVCLGDIALALGDYRNAVFYYGQTTLFPVGMAKISDEAGYRKYYMDPTPRRLYHAGDLPYTANLHKLAFDQYPLSHDDESYYYAPLIVPEVDKLAKDIVRNDTPLVDERFCRLRHAAGLLEWADALYRTDESSNMARARELYKAALWLHKRTPPISPDWDDVMGAIAPYIPPYGHLAQNPALIGQLTRARLGIYQLEAGLNYYGCTESIVPTLRYRPLKDAADSLVAGAKSAQEDFLLYMGNMEQLCEEVLRENILTTNMLKKASIQAKIAGEQIKIAGHGVNAAQNQVAELDVMISEKRHELDKDFWSELVTFIGGMITAYSGASSKTSAASSVVGTGGSVYGALLYAGYSSASSMSDQYEQIANDIESLKKARADALVYLDIKKSELKIANYQLQLANADAELATELAAKLGFFRETKVLNIDFWVNLAALMKRLMRRYLELGARYAWLAERALAYEQDRAIRIIRFDYIPLQYQNVTGADLLQLDLAELESSCLSGIRQTVPVKHTYSIATSFPLQFARLKQTGRCSFLTQEAFFRQAYPGTYGYRLHGVSVAAIGMDSARIEPVRGLLTNQGISVLSRHDGQTHLSVRPANGLPLSEFRLRDDMNVFGLPDEALMPFEGSGVETMWALEFPGGANPFGLVDVADILLTFDMRVQYSPELRDNDIAASPAAVMRFVFMAASKFAPQALGGLAGEAMSATIEFDFSSLPLPENEANRRVRNLVIFLAGGEPLDFKAAFAATVPAATVAIEFKKGMTASNVAPLNSEDSASVLNSFVNNDADQTFKLIVNKADNPGIQFDAVKDVILGIEYSADVSK